MASRRENPIPSLTEYPDGDYGGDFLDGVMAGLEEARAKFPRQDVIFVAHQSGNALETIGPDNFRGAPPKPEAEIEKIGIDNFRGSLKS